MATTKRLRGPISSLECLCYCLVVSKITPSRSIPPRSRPRRLILHQASIPACSVDLAILPTVLSGGLDSWQIDLALTKTTKITERVSAEFGVQAFNILNHVQLGDASISNLQFNYAQLSNGAWALQSPSALGLITTTNNFNNNNDNKTSPNTGTGLPRQLEFMLRFQF